jgi:hypothetical protein
MMSPYFVPLSTTPGDQNKSTRTISTISYRPTDWPTGARIGISAGVPAASGRKGQAEVFAGRPLPVSDLSSFLPLKKATSISSLIYYIDVGLNLIWILFFRFRTLLLIYILDYSDILPFAVHPLFAVAVLSLIQAKVPRPARKC